MKTILGDNQQIELHEEWVELMNQFLEKRRVEEIDLALTKKDKRRFMELTSADWKDAM